MNSIRIDHISQRLSIKQLSLIILNMKLVLKYKETIKLYAGEMNYQKIVQFMSTEMQLKKESIQTTYTDEDGDQIYLGDSNDLEVLTTLTDNKSYVKINVKGQGITEDAKNNTMIDYNSLNQKNSQEAQIKMNSQKSLEQKPKSRKSPDGNEVVNQKPKKKKVQTKTKSKGEKSPQKQQKTKKQVKKQKKQQPQEIHADQMKKFSKLMTQTITAIVDERLNALGSCKRKKQSDNSKKVQEKKQQLVYKGFTCKSCLISPIVGIRFECPKCINFSLCQECEQNYEHDHNMLKIKRIRQSENEKDKTVNKNMKKIYELIVPQNKKKQKQQKPVIDQKAVRNCKQLKMIFGGKASNYQLFVEKYPHLQFNQLLEAYCIDHNIEIEQGKEKYIEMLSTRLAKLNKIQPNQLKSFVKKNIKLNYNSLVQRCKIQHKQMIQLQKTQKEEVKQNHQKIFFLSEDQINEGNKSESRNIQKQAEKSRVIINSQENQQSKLEENKQNEKKTMPIVINKKVQEILEVKQEPLQQKKSQQEQIFDLMIQIFGDERCREYSGFIDEHLKEGKETIIILWASNISNRDK